MLRIPAEFKTDIMSAANPPAASCQDGATVIFETSDCFDSAVSKDGIMDG